IVSIMSIVIKEEKKMHNLLNPLRELKTVVGYTILTAVVVALFSVWVFLDEAKAEVVIAADGDVQKVKTSSDTVGELLDDVGIEDRKSTRLNSSHVSISYAVFCLKKKIVKHIDY